jgi:uncharacterized membrane protein HdeD (DUF308 family)
MGMRWCLVIRFGLAFFVHSQKLIRLTVAFAIFFQLKGIVEAFVSALHENIFNYKFFMLSLSS